MASSISRLQAGNIDGRSRSPRFIQDQLQALHASLLDNAPEIREAIALSSQHTAAEIGIEYYLAISCVKAQYASVDFDQMLEDEYSIAKGKDASNRRVAGGIVYVTPASHTLLYSVIAPLSAAIAAGNVVAVELGRTSSAINSVLRKILSAALDRDTFTILDSRPDDEAFLASCIQFLPTASTTPSPSVLVSPSTSRAVAIVDRSSDLKSAASSIVKARFNFGGSSPYAPDLVLVNEFVLDEFSDLVVKEAAAIFSQNASATVSGKKGKGQVPDDYSKEGTVVLSGNSGSIVTVKNSESKILQVKSSDPVLVLHPFTSLNRAIEVANRGDDPLLASYIFGDLGTAKYLTQFIESHLSLINNIPVELLVGPPTPLSYTPSLSATARFTKDMFTVSRPAFICKASAITTALTTSTNLAELEKEALKPLPPTGQRPGKALGFFEQGIVIGLVTIFLPIAVSSLGLLGYGGVRAVRYLRS